MAECQSAGRNTAKKNIRKTQRDWQTDRRQEKQTDRNKFKPNLFGQRLL